MDKTKLETLILTKIPDYLKFPKNILFSLIKGRKIPKVPQDSKVVWWSDMMAKTYAEAPLAEIDPHDLAVILYSGGTTGTPKGIMLSNLNFISEGLQVANWAGMDESIVMLAILPIFHGFGLGGASMPFSWEEENRSLFLPLPRKQWQNW